MTTNLSISHPRRLRPCLLLAAYILTAVCALALPHPAKGQPPSHRDILYQASTIEALLAGLYDATTTCGSVKQHGDFGLGTFAGLDGEMIVLDGEIYKAAADGTVTVVPDEEGTPFAAVTWFDSDALSKIETTSDIEDLKTKLDTILPGRNRFYAIRLTGTFQYVKTRSVPKQTPPYPALTDVVAQQSTFEKKSVQGTVIGLYSPSFVNKLNVPGYHFHFLSNDKKFGGHLLDIKAKHLTLALDITNGFAVQLSGSEAFQGMNFDKDTSKDLHKVETDADKQ